VDFFDVIKERYSVRAYDSRPVEEEKLIQILEAGRLAPSAVNYQPLPLWDWVRVGCAPSMRPSVLRC
jgi:nitroreductase